MFLEMILFIKIMSFNFFLLYIRTIVCYEVNIFETNNEIENATAKLVGKKKVLGEVLTN